MKKALVAPILAALIALPVLFLAGCANDDVGIPCKSGEVPAGTGGGTGESDQTPQVTSNALDCRSRLCLAIGDRSDTSVRPLCTKICESDGDCPDSGDACPKGEKFVCRVAVVTGGLACCKMCICNAFINNKSLTSTTVCDTITPNCPQL